jgi:hypothetical protein
MVVLLLDYEQLNLWISIERGEIELNLNVDEVLEVLITYPFGQKKVWLQLVEPRDGHGRSGTFVGKKRVLEICQKNLYSGVLTRPTFLLEMGKSKYKE